MLFSITKDDLRIDTFRAGGKGGQNQNKRNTGCRITHIESGAVGEARDERSFEQNRRNAYKRMVASGRFQAWLQTEIVLRTQVLTQVQREDGTWEVWKIELGREG